MSRRVTDVVLAVAWLALSAVAACASPRPPALPPVDPGELSALRGARSHAAQRAAGDERTQEVGALGAFPVEIYLHNRALSQTWAGPRVATILDAIGGRYTGTDDPSLPVCLGVRCARNGASLATQARWTALLARSVGSADPELVVVAHEGTDELSDGVIEAASRRAPSGATLSDPGETGAAVRAVRGKFGDRTAVYLRARSGEVVVAREARGGDVARTLREARLASPLGPSELVRVRVARVNVGVLPVVDEARGVIARAPDGVTFALSAEVAFATEALAELAVQRAAEERRRAVVRFFVGGLLDGISIERQKATVRVAGPLAREDLSRLLELVAAHFGADPAAPPTGARP